MSVRSHWLQWYSSPLLLIVTLGVISIIDHKIQAGLEGIQRYGKIEIIKYDREMVEKLLQSRDTK